jgi:thiol-disulfide isomerase/thioredoxin
MESWFGMDSLEGVKKMLGPVDIGHEGWEGSLERRTIIYFSAEWCTPCKKLAPMLEKTVRKYKDDIDFIKVDADAEKPLVNFYGIKSVPTFVLVKGNDSFEVTPVTVNPQFLEDYFYKALIKK